MCKPYCNRLLLFLLLYSSSDPSVLPNVSSVAPFLGVSTRNACWRIHCIVMMASQENDVTESLPAVAFWGLSADTLFAINSMFFLHVLHFCELSMVNEISLLTAIHGTKMRGPPLTANRNFGEHFCACCHAKFSGWKQLELPHKTISLYWLGRGVEE